MALRQGWAWRMSLLMIWQVGGIIMMMIMIVMMIVGGVVSDS